MRSFVAGTIAAAASMSVLICPGTAIAFARSAGSRTDISPMGLSSRTTSPVSVTHDVVCSPANSMSTRNAGMDVLPVRTTSRRPMSTVTGALRSVAGSNTFH